jgi:hypothetical protein
MARGPNPAKFSRRLFRVVLRVVCGSLCLSRVSALRAVGKNFKPHLVMAKGNNSHRKEVKKPKKEKPKPQPTRRGS